jgi:hypothetical protein
MEVITLTMYLKNYKLVTPIIAFKFLQDGRPFLLGAIGANNLGSLPL